MKILKTIDAEKNNFWSFVTLLVETAAAAYLAYLAYEQVGHIAKILLAVVSSVLIINLLAKVYALTRK